MCAHERLDMKSKSELRLGVKQSGSRAGLDLFSVQWRRPRGNPSATGLLFMISFRGNSVYAPLTSPLNSLTQFSEVCCCRTGVLSKGLLGCGRCSVMTSCSSRSRGRRRQSSCQSLTAVAPSVPLKPLANCAIIASLRRVTMASKVAVRDL